MPNDSIDTTVGANVELKGSLRNQGPIHIHGKVIGDIHSDSLVVVGETAVITGPINARQVDVAGQVHGAIVVTEQIELQPKSLVKGDITSAVLSIKPGAVFIGKSQMNSNHIAEEMAQEVNEEDKKKPRLEIE
jgi:cytoskeletal protein CcmA (bactofilin family)